MVIYTIICVLMVLANSMPNKNFSRQMTEYVGFRIKKNTQLSGFLGKMFLFSFVFFHFHIQNFDQQ